MRIHNLYVDDKGETHFRDIEVEWKNEGRGGKTSATFRRPASSSAKRQAATTTRGIPRRAGNTSSTSTAR